MVVRTSETAARPGTFRRPYRCLHRRTSIRCNQDGSDLEEFAFGLRNPQELVFDELGNLFTGDNNSDGGDRARWVHVVEGGDSGWRVGWQFIEYPNSRGPWNAEKMWHPQIEVPEVAVRLFSQKFRELWATIAR